MSKFYYGKNFIISESNPCCKICGKEIIVARKNRQNRMIGCSNEHCKAHNTKSVKCLIHMAFGEEALNEYVANLKKTRVTSKEYWINKGFSDEEALVKVKEIQSKRSLKNKKRGKCDKETIISKLGEDKAAIFFREKSRFCIEYWLKRGYNEEDAQKNISSLQSKTAKMQDFSKKNTQSPRCIEYWMIRSGMTEEEAIKQVSEYQKTFTKEKCIEKYGPEEGLKIWQNRQDKWQESLHKSKKLHVGYSKISQTLFNEILKSYKPDEQDYVFYGSKNREYSIRENNTNYIYDFTDLNKRKIIEFQGDIYHGNPDFFQENDIPNPYHKNKTAKDLWEFDEHKKQIAINNGFDVFIIWENKYREDKEKILKDCLKFLNIC